MLYFGMLYVIQYVIKYPEGAKDKCIMIYSVV